MNNSFHPSINKSQIKNLRSLRFIENILFYCTLLVCKTHLAIRIEIIATTTIILDINSSFLLNLL